MGIIEFFRKQRQRKQKEMEDAEQYLFDDTYTIAKGSQDILAFAQYMMVEYRLWADLSLREARAQGKSLRPHYPTVDFTDEELSKAHAWHVDSLYEDVRKGLKTIDRCLEKYNERKEEASPKEKEEAQQNVKLALLTLWDVYRHDGSLLAGCPALEEALPRAYV